MLNRDVDIIEERIESENSEPELKQIIRTANLSLCLQEPYSYVEKVSRLYEQGYF